MDKDNLITFLIFVGVILAIIIFALTRKPDETDRYKIVPYNNESVLLLNTRSGETKLIRNKNSNIELELIDIYENNKLNSINHKEYIDSLKYEFDTITND